MNTDTVSGIYAPGKDWYNALPYVWAHGGEIAVQDGDVWDAQFSSDESLAGLSSSRRSTSTPPTPRPTATRPTRRCRSAPARSATSRLPAWVKWSILAAGRRARTPGCPDTYGADLAAFPLPGLEAGETAPIFAGGSNVAVAQKSDAPEKAKAALEIMLSEGYQKLLAEGGLTPGIISAAQFLPDDAITQAQATALANSKFTPMSPNWGEVEGPQSSRTRSSRSPRAATSRRSRPSSTRPSKRSSTTSDRSTGGSRSRAWAPPACPRITTTERRRHEREHRTGRPAPPQACPRRCREPTRTSRERAADDAARPRGAWTPARPRR